VTGAAGFIGSHLCAALLKRSHSVYAVDDLSGGRLTFLPKVTEFIHDDFASSKFLFRVTSGEFDVVVHLAAKPRVAFSVANPVLTHDTNVTKTLLLLDACRVHGHEPQRVRRFVFASSSSVLGGANTFTHRGGDFVEVIPQHETDTPQPRSPYALQKLIIEQYLRQYYTHYRLESVALRFFNVFGPQAMGGSPYSTAIAAWLTAIKEGKPLRFDGDGTQSRDMCYVDNVVDCIIKAAETDEQLEGAPIHVACNATVSNNQIFKYLEERYGPLQRTEAPDRPGDVKYTLACIDRANELLEYKPIVSTMEGLKRTCDWYDDCWPFISKQL
jgi:UDP-glucose 4-epimerase